MEVGRQRLNPWDQLVSEKVLERKVDISKKRGSWLDLKIELGGVEKR